LLQVDLREIAKHVHKIMKSLVEKTAQLAAALNPKSEMLPAKAADVIANYPREIESLRQAALHECTLDDMTSGHFKGQWNGALILSQASCAYQTDTETRKPETYPFKLFYSDLLAMKADAIQVKRARESGVDHGAVEARVSLRRWLWYLLMWHRESFTLTKPIRLQNPLARGYVSDSPPARPPVAASTTPLRA
jgi:hypothetical protein